MEKLVHFLLRCDKNVNILAQQMAGSAQRRRGAARAHHIQRKKLILLDF